MKCFPLVCWFYFTFSCFIASCFSCHICSLSPVKKWVLISSCGPQVTKMWKEKRAQMYIWVHEQEVRKWHSYDFFSDQDIYLQSSKSWGTKYFPPCWQTSQWRPCVGKYTRYLLVCDMRSNSKLSGPRPFVMLLFCPMLEPGYWECPTNNCPETVMTFWLMLSLSRQDSWFTYPWFPNFENYTPKILHRPWLLWIFFSHSFTYFSGA